MTGEGYDIKMRRGLREVEADLKNLIHDLEDVAENIMTCEKDVDKVSMPKTMYYLRQAWYHLQEAISYIDLARADIDRNLPKAMMEQEN